MPTLTEDRAQLLIDVIRMMRKDFVGIEGDLSQLTDEEVQEAFNGNFDSDSMPLLESILLEAGYTGWLTDKIGRKFYFEDGKRVSRAEMKQKGIDPEGMDQVPDAAQAPFQGVKAGKEMSGKAKAGALSQEDQQAWDNWQKANKADWERVKQSVVAAANGKLTKELIDEYSRIVTDPKTTVGVLKQIVRELIEPAGEKKLGYSGNKAQVVERAKKLLEIVSGQAKGQEEPATRQDPQQQETAQVEPEVQAQEPTAGPQEIDVKQGDNVQGWVVTNIIPAMPPHTSVDVKTGEEKEYSGREALIIAENEEEDMGAEFTMDEWESMKNKSSDDSSSEPEVQQAETPQEEVPAVEPEQKKQASKLDGKNMKYAIAETINDLIKNEYSFDRMPPIYKIKERLKEIHGDFNDSIFVDAMRQLERSGHLRLIEISDESKATPDQLKNSVPGIDGTVFYAEVKNSGMAPPRPEGFTGKERKPVDKQKLNDEVASGISDIFSKSNGPFVEVHELRDRIREKLGDDAANADNFNEVVKQLERDKKIRLVSINDLSNTNMEQLGKSIPGVDETYFYIEPTDKFEHPQSQDDSPGETVEEPESDKDGLFADDGLDGEVFTGGSDEAVFHMGDEKGQNAEPEPAPEEPQAEEPPAGPMQSETQQEAPSVGADDFLGMSPEGQREALADLSNDQKRDLQKQLNAGKYEDNPAAERAARAIQDTLQVEMDDEDEPATRQDPQPEPAQTEEPEPEKFDKGEAVELEGADRAEDDAANFKYMTDEEFANADPEAAGFVKDGDRWVHGEHKTEDGEEISFTRKSVTGSASQAEQEFNDRVQKELNKDDSDVEVVDDSESDVETVDDSGEIDPSPEDAAEPEVSSKEKKKLSTEPKSIDDAKAALQDFYDSASDLSAWEYSDVESLISNLNKNFNLADVKKIAKEFGVSAGVASKSGALRKIEHKIKERRSRNERSKVIADAAKQEFSDKAKQELENPEPAKTPKKRGRKKKQS